MNLNARRFARRILIINGILLLVVLLVVSFAARAIYTGTREEVVRQAEARQAMLADETARGIENHYKSIVDVMDLMHTDETEETDDATTEKSTPTADQKQSQLAIDRAVAANRGSLIAEVMWEQLQDRVAAFYLIELRPGPRPGPTIKVEAVYPGVRAELMSTSVVGPLQKQLKKMSELAHTTITNGQGSSVITLQFKAEIEPGAALAATRNAIDAAKPELPKDLPNPPTASKVETGEPAAPKKVGGRGVLDEIRQGGGGGGGGGPGRRFDSNAGPSDPPPDRGQGRNGPDRGSNRNETHAPATTRPAAGPTSRVIGSSDSRLVFDDVFEACRPWFANVKMAATVGAVQTIDGVLVNVVCVPTRLGRALAAVVPIRGVEARFLDPLRSDPMTAVWVVDENGDTIASSRAGLDGVAIPKSAGLPAPIKGTTGGRHTTAVHIGMGAFEIGQVKFGPSIVTAENVNVAGKEWTLYTATDLEEVDDVVKPLFRRAVWWCLFVVFSITAILVSTAVSMIRNRLRTERLRHDLLKRELDQARRIQLAWLPADRAAGDAVDVAAVNQPASHISGDFYNWFDLTDGRTVVTIGDVTGHGMSAAFLMATTQLLVRNTMARLPDPGECLAEVNRQLCVQVFNGQFVTMLVLVLDAVGGHLEIATAGHPAPLMADGESFQPLAIEPQLVLGVDANATYVTERFDLPAEATLLLYTDGVVECPNPGDARFGNERLRRALYGRYETARTVVDQVVKAVDGFRGQRELDDDLTIVALQLQPSGTAKRSAGVVPV